MNIKASGSFIPDTNSNPPRNENPERDVTNAKMRRILKQMHARQQTIEAELERTRSTLNDTEAGRRLAAPAAAPREDIPLRDLIRQIMEAFTKA